MERIVHSLVQGAPAWDEFRLTHFGGSEIAAVMGLSKTTTRTELLRAKKTGIAKEFGEWLQRNVLDRGHEIESLARPLAVEFAGVDGFYPATVSIGRISASTDGVDMLDETAWECKSLNSQNGPIVRAGQVPEEHMPQCQQVLMITGADRLLFTVSDGTRENTFHVWVDPDTNWFDRIRAAWAQFEIDLAAYSPPEAAAPAPTGRAPETLPALLITVKGEVTASNLAEFKETALTAIRSVNRELTTDQHFADAEKAVKWCSDIEERVAGAKQHALSQTATIDQLFKTMDDISAEARQVRLDLEKLVKARKLSLKTEILVEAQTALASHLREQNAKLGRDYMPQITADFAGAIHGKKNFDSMRAAINATLANAKIEANAVADKIQRNLTTLKELASDYKFLFSDTGTIVLKAPDDLQALVKSRIADHKAETERKEQETRDRIRAEEQEKAEKDARDKLAREQAEQAEADEKLRAEAIAAEKAAQQGIEEARAAEALPTPLLDALSHTATTLRADVVSSIDAKRVLSAAHRSSAAALTPPTLKLGDINALLSPISLTADGLTSLGFPPAATDKNAKLYHQRDLTRMCGALHDLLNQVQAKQAA